MRLRRLGLSCAAIAALALVNGAPARADVLIQIDKSEQRMTVTVDGAERYQWPVSTGRARYDTPDGAYTPVSMETMHYSRQWDNAPMPHSIFFTEEGHAIHGTYEESHLGSPVSHGCVRLSRKNATTLYALVEKEGKAHTMVVLTGTLHEGRTLVAHRARSRHAEQLAARTQDNTATAAPTPAQRHPRYARTQDDDATAAPVPAQRHPRYARTQNDDATAAPAPAQRHPRYARSDDADNEPAAAPVQRHPRYARTAPAYPYYYDNAPRVYAVAPRYSGSWHDDDRRNYVPRRYYYGARGPYPF